MMNAGDAAGHLLAETNECAPGASPCAVAVSSRMRLHMGNALEVRSDAICQALSATPTGVDVLRCCLTRLSC